MCMYIYIHILFTVTERDAPPLLHQDSFTQTCFILYCSGEPVTTKLAHVHEQSEFTYGGYLVAAEHV